MAYLSHEELDALGFKKLGNNVKISDKASIYTPEMIEIGDHSRIDDFCVISGRVNLGKFCHIAPMCLVAGGEPGISLADFCGLAYGVKIFSQSDDYSGESMTNPLIPGKYKKEYFKKISFGRHVIIGTNAVILPGVEIGEGCSVGAMSLVNKSVAPWGVYIGNPVRRVRERSKNLLELEKKFLQELSDHDSI